MAGLKASQEADQREERLEGLGGGAKKMIGITPQHAAGRAFPGLGAGVGDASSMMSMSPMN